MARPNPLAARPSSRDFDPVAPDAFQAIPPTDPRSQTPGALGGSASSAPSLDTPGSLQGTPARPPRSTSPEAHRAASAAEPSSASPRSPAHPQASDPRTVAADPRRQNLHGAASVTSATSVDSSTGGSASSATDPQLPKSAAAAEGQVEQPQHKREVWVRSKSASVQRILDRSTESMSPEERTAYSVLSEMIPSTVALQSLRLSENGTTVRVEIRNPSRTEWADIERIKSEFRELTGRELMVYQLPEQSPATQRPRPASSAPSENFWTARPSASPSEAHPASRRELEESAGSLSGRSTPSVAPVRSTTFVDRSPHVQTQGGSTEPTAEAATAAALAGAPSYLPPDLITYGRVTRVDLSAIGPADSSSSGSATRGRDALPPRRAQEEQDSEQSKRQQQERAGLAARDGSLEDPIKERPLEAVRIPLEEPHDRSEENSGRRGGSGSCPTCGTELPEQQAQACPVCAQSGPDVIAKTCVNYRFAGAKFLATVDAFSATAQAREMLAQGQVEPVASLRYQQKLVGHKDLLKFRGESG